MNCCCTRWIFGRLGILVAVLCLSGCGGGAGNPHPVEPEAALTTLKDVLESWKQGESPESWQTNDPEVVVQDMDWKSGAKLKHYEIIDEGKAVDANLQCQVKLTLIDAKGQESEKTVTYLVGTSPVLTVFRQVVM